MCHCKSLQGLLVLVKTVVFILNSYLSSAISMQNNLMVPVISTEAYVMSNKITLAVFFCKMKLICDRLLLRFVISEKVK